MNWVRTTTGVLAGCACVATASGQLPGWMATTGNATIDIGNPAAAGFHRADSTIGTVAGDAVYSLNSGSLGNWTFRDDADVASIPGGSSIDSEYGQSRTVDFSVTAPDTLQINSVFGYGATGPAFGEGEDTVVEQQLLRIVAQEDIEVMISTSSFISGGADAGSGSFTVSSSFGGIFEDLSQISPTFDGTYNFVAGRIYDIFTTSTLIIHENQVGFDNAGFGLTVDTTLDLKVIPEPASLALLSLAGLTLLRRRG